MDSVILNSVYDPLYQWSSSKLMFSVNKSPRDAKTKKKKTKKKIPTTLIQDFFYINKRFFLFLRLPRMDLVQVH